MHAERNYLVKFVLPRLKKSCLERRIHLVEVDLRWGVTAEEAQSGKALEICLSQVDQCNVFTAIIGSRYGWVPAKSEVSNDIAIRYEWQDGLSVTHMEIWRAALRKKTSADTEHACFFLRDGSEAIAAALPTPQMKSAFDETDPSKKSKVNQLRQDIQKRFSAFRYQFVISHPQRGRSTC
jgi:nephrocystin-3